jgi:tyrosyl-tRNA synthetase
VAGIELIRKMRQETAFGITFPLITTASGAKMGKTAAGAVWLDSKRTPPYDYYQYWINTDDKDVGRFLALYTFLPMEEITVVETLEGARLNSAKAVLAFETTQLVHGRDEAVNAMRAAASVFGSRDIPLDVLPSSSIPREEETDNDDSVPKTIIGITELKEGLPLFKVFHRVGLAKSGAAARRLIEQGGAYVNGHRVDSVDYLLTETDAGQHEIVLRSGKKRFHKLLIE